ncbi:hypothetical protein [Jiangella alkaliphila]|uniref:AbiV family abortive infection protein n=1 Tax=Jiangella alkaliphila TaxID=419479 RepID=A0A1H2K2C8_9ACTN|nr:hypothetical protein [Jiangella alkaliphila]SDU62839.1 hypothetical protein SAMN04488563_3346 [Jiangella alkaliphila]
MPIVGLDRERGFALIAEMNSTRNLLAYGLRVLRTAAFVETTRDPILTMLSIGVEKLYKLTLGIVALDRDQAWPSAQETMAWGHKLDEMHEAVMAELRVRTADTSEHVRARFAGVEADPVVEPVIEALDMYGRRGRFFFLDLLGEKPQSWVGPDAAWQKIESAALADPAVATLYSATTTNVGDNDIWADFVAGLNERIALAVEQLWTMVAVCGRNHALGETGVVFGFEVHPGAVGRQVSGR